MASGQRIKYYMAKLGKSLYFKTSNVAKVLLCDTVNISQEAAPNQKNHPSLSHETNFGWWFLFLIIADIFLF